MTYKPLTFWGNEPAKFVVILLSGKAGAGKTTSAKMISTYLSNKFRYLAQVLSFASAIKYIASEYLSWNGEKDEKGRRLLQHLGDVGREYDENLWAKNLIFSVNMLYYHPDFVIVDDWRYPNEGEYIASLENYEVVKVKIRSNNLGLSGEEAKHTSENSLPEAEEYYDYILDNTGTLEDLNVQCEQMINRMLKGEK